MIRYRMTSLLFCLAIAPGVTAETLFINDATVHTMSSQSMLQNGDILVRDGRIRSVGVDLSPPSDARVIEAKGRPVTPGFFAGITQTGLVEISAVESSVDSALAVNSALAVDGLRPEFDITTAYNPNSSLVPITRIEGYTWAMLGEPLLTVAGRQAIEGYKTGGIVVFNADRASDILQVIAFSEKHGLSTVINGGTEAWLVADQLAEAGVPVLVNPLVNLPETFDQLSARLDNAALLNEAGVTFAFAGAGTHQARKLRQMAGNAVSNGLPYEAGLAALTISPVVIFALGEDHGSIKENSVANLVIWSGDPLEVTSVADQVIISGKMDPMVSRQTLLRDRYLPEESQLPRAYIKP